MPKPTLDKRSYRILRFSDWPVADKPTSRDLAGPVVLPETGALFFVSSLAKKQATAPMRLDTTNISQALMASVPGVRHLLQDEEHLSPELTSSYYAFFARVVQPYMFTVIRSPEHKGELERLFSFFEQMMCADSVALEDVLVLEIIEPLRGSKDALRAVWPYMGERTRKLTQKTQKWRFRPWLASILARLFLVSSRKSI
jgi:hypothetical protein